MVAADRLIKPPAAVARQRAAAPGNPQIQHRADQQEEEKERHGGEFTEMAGAGKGGGTARGNFFILLISLYYCEVGKDFQLCAEARLAMGFADGFLVFAGQPPSASRSGAISQPGAGCSAAQVSTVSTSNTRLVSDWLCFCPVAARRSSRIILPAAGRNSRMGLMPRGVPEILRAGGRGGSSAASCWDI